MRQFHRSDREVLLARMGDFAAGHNSQCTGHFLSYCLFDFLRIVSKERAARPEYNNRQALENRGDSIGYKPQFMQILGGHRDVKV